MNVYFSFIVGDKCTYTDLTLFHVLRATEFQFQDAWNKADYIPALKAYKERIAARPNIAAYLKSDRALPFAGDSMMWRVTLNIKVIIWCMEIKSEFIQNVLRHLDLRLFTFCIQ